MKTLIKINHSIFLCFFSISLAACSGADLSEFKTQQSSGGETTGAGQNNVADGSEDRFPYALGKLSSYFDLGSLTFLKGHNRTAEEFVEEVNSRAQDEEYVEPTIPTPYWRNKVTVSSSEGLISLSFSRAEIVKVPDRLRLYKVDEDSVKSCQLEVRLSLNEIAKLSSLVENLKYCRVREKDLKGMLRFDPPEGAILFSEANGYQSVLVNDYHGDEKRLDLLTDNYLLRTYVHNFVCGERTALMEFINERVGSDVLSLESCPVPPDRFDPRLEL